jgi:Stealth protein CR4, conserved region 4
VQKQVRAGESPALSKQRKVDFFCLNDGSFRERSTQERADVLLRSYYPVPAPWERAAGDE